MNNKAVLPLFTTKRTNTLNLTHLGYIFLDFVEFLFPNHSQMSGEVTSLSSQKPVSTRSGDIFMLHTFVEVWKSVVYYFIYSAQTYNFSFSTFVVSSNRAKANLPILE